MLCASVPRQGPGAGGFSKAWGVRIPALVGAALGWRLSRVSSFKSCSEKRLSLNGTMKNHYLGVFLFLPKVQMLNENSILIVSNPGSQRIHLSTMRIVHPGFPFCLGCQGAPSRMYELSHSLWGFSGEEALTRRPKGITRIRGAEWGAARGAGTLTPPIPVFLRAGSEVALRRLPSRRAACRLSVICQSAFLLTCAGSGPCPATRRLLSAPRGNLSLTLRCGAWGSRSLGQDVLGQQGREARGSDSCTGRCSQTTVETPRDSCHSVTNNFPVTGRFSSRSLFPPRCGARPGCVCFSAPRTPREPSTRVLLRVCHRRC